MSDVTERKRLFAETYRRRPHDGAARPRLLGGQAQAQAHRLSQPSRAPDVLVTSLWVLDILAILLCGLWASGAVGVDALVSITGRLGIVWLGALFALAVVRLVGGYRFRRIRRLEIGLPLSLAGMAGALAALYPLLLGLGLPAPVAQAWVVDWMVPALGLAGVTRLGLWLRIRQLMRRGVLEHRIVLVGGGDDLAPLIREIDRDRGKGRRLCGFFDARMDPRSPSIVEGHHKMGDIDDLVEFARLARIHMVVIAIPNASLERIQELLARLFVLPVDIRVLEGAEIPAYSRKRRSRIGKFTLIEIYKRPIDGGKALQKRVFDLIFASMALVAFLPLMLVIAALIKLESRGPVLFKQRRHGFNNKPIEVLKFRSMYTDQCDPTAVKAVRRGDSRVTRIGRFIRRASIDELPQFVNVLRGELSLVGPRPHAMAARTGDIVYDQVTDAYSARHRVKPGVTGWAQINGWRGEMNSSEKIRGRVAHDLYYIENWSLWLDFKIMMLTPWSLVATKNAY